MHCTQCTIRWLSWCKRSAALLHGRTAARPHCKPARLLSCPPSHWTSSILTRSHRNHTYPNASSLVLQLAPDMELEDVHKTKIFRERLQCNSSAYMVTGAGIPHFFVLLHSVLVAFPPLPLSPPP